MLWVLDGGGSQLRLRLEDFYKATQRATENCIKASQPY